jgi:hypothetical protein
MRLLREEFVNSTARSSDWVVDAEARLIGRFMRGSGWSYMRQGKLCAESTALACLALRSQGPTGHQASSAVEAAAGWLASIQKPSGAVGISEEVPSPAWPTPYALLAWSGLKEHAESVQRGCDWLLRLKGTTIEIRGDVFGHDTTIAGWPWNAGTHSWVEPTAMAVIALKRHGLNGHYRVREGVRLIADRAISDGGWNFGNNVVFGTTLRPQPASTGMALAALSGVYSPNSIISSACDYLEDSISSLRAPQSLCWSLLGLNAWGRHPTATSHLLEASYERVLKRGEKSPQLSYLLLAAGKQTPGLLGIQSNERKGNR